MTTIATITPNFIFIIVLVIIIISVFVFIIIKAKRRSQKSLIGTGRRPSLAPKSNESLARSSISAETLNRKNIFISHIENDAILAFEIAKGLENGGFKTWYYERDSLPGVSYLVQTCTAIEESQAVVVIISQSAMNSKQMTVEIVRAHEAGKPIIPILRGISHQEFRSRQPEWTEAFGAATSITAPTDSVISILPKIIGGLIRLGVPSNSANESNTTE